MVVVIHDRGDKIILNMFNRSRRRSHSGSVGDSSSCEDAVRHMRIVLTNVATPKMRLASSLSASGVRIMGARSSRSSFLGLLSPNQRFTIWDTAMTHVLARLGMETLMCPLTPVVRSGISHARLCRAGTDPHDRTYVYKTKYAVQCN